MVVPPEAIVVPNPPYNYYLWSELEKDSGVEGIVRLHIFFGGDPDDACVCAAYGFTESLMTQIWDIIEILRREAIDKMAQHGWQMRGTPETVVTCSHDFDPR